jgi:hypothetical protein
MLANKILRYKVMDKHRELVRAGKLLEARELLRLLRKGKIKLGLGDIDWEVERICEELGCRINYRGRGYTCTVILNRR